MLEEDYFHLNFLLWLPLSLYRSIRGSIVGPLSYAVFQVVIPRTFLG